MTMGISRIFRSTDANAPILSGSAGSLAALLKAVLVDGYSGTQSLGWTLEQIYTNTMVYRMKGGTKTFIRLDDTGIYSSLQYPVISAFATMSSLNNGTERIPAHGYEAYLYKYETAGSPIPWIIVGDDAGIWILIKAKWYTGGVGVNTGANLFSVFYVGDYNAWDARNKWNFCLLGCATGATISLHPHAPSLSIPHLAARGSSFVKGCIYVGIYPFNNASYFGQNMLVSNSFGANKLNGVFMDSPIHLYETTSVGNIILGSLPGMAEPIMIDTTTALSVSATEPVESVDADGNRSIFFYNSHTNTNLSVINKLIVKIGKGFRNVQ